MLQTTEVPTIYQTTTALNNNNSTEQQQKQVKLVILLGESNGIPSIIWNVLEKLYSLIEMVISGLYHSIEWNRYQEVFRFHSKDNVPFLSKNNI